MAPNLLYDIPDELQIAIIKLLPPADRTAVCATSRRLQQLAHQVLYSHLELNWMGGENPPVLLLIRSILENPEICRCIRSLRLSDYNPSTVRGNWQHASNEFVQLPTWGLTKALLSTGISESTSRTWKSNILSGSADAIVALLVTLSPKLKTLSISSDWAPSTIWLSWLIRAALISPQQDRYRELRPMFQSLTHVTIASGLRRDREGLGDALPLFYLPSLEHLSTSVDKPLEFEWPGQDQDPPTPAALTSLALRRLQERWLGSLLAPLTNLRKFRYFWYPSQAHTRVLLDVMASAIAQCSNLTELEIKASEMPIGNGFDTKREPKLLLCGLMNKLSELSQLRTITIPWVFLCGLTPNSDRTSAGKILLTLPRGIQHVTLTADLEELSDCEWTTEDMVVAVKSELENCPMSHYENLMSIWLPDFIPKDGVREEFNTKLESLSHRFNVLLMIPEPARWYNRVLTM